MKNWWNDYVGVPYKKMGRDINGLDCWGLVRLIYKEQYNIDLPSYVDEYQEGESETLAEIIAINKENWVKVDTPTIGDVLLLRSGRFLSHVGVVISPNQFIHVRETTNTVIERFDHGKWSYRKDGAYRYVEKQSIGDLSVHVCANPLKSERIDGHLPADSSINEIIDYIKHQYPITAEYENHVVIMVNGVPIPQDQWEMRPIAGDVITYRAVAGDDVIGTILSIAVIVAAAYFAPGLLSTFGFEATAMNLAIAQGIISVVGTMLVSAIFPIRPPEMPQIKDPGIANAQKLLQGGSNTANPYGAIPVVLGMMRFTAPLGAQIYAEANADASYLRMLLVWGYGPLEISDMRIGEIDINSLEELNYETVNGLNDPLTNRDRFNSIYPNDVEQQLLNVNLTGSDDTPPSPWVERTINELCDSLNVVLHFPEGLRKLAMDGENAGDVFEQLFQADIQVRKVDPATLNPLEAWANIEKVFKQTTLILSGAFFGQKIIYGGGWAGTTTSPTPVYRWTSICLDKNNNLILRQGSYTDNPAQNPSGNILAALQATTKNLNTTYNRFATIPADETEIHRVCMYGATVYSTTDLRSSIVGTYTGLALTTRTNTYGNYNIGSVSAIGTQSVVTVQSEATIAAGTLNRTGRNQTVYIGVAGTEFVKRKDAFSYNVTFQVPYGKYQIRVRRITTTENEETVGDVKYRKFYISLLSAITAYGNTRPVVEPKPLAMTAIRVKATDQFNGNLEGISATVQSICLDWDDSGSVWRLRPTRNPASLFRYVLQHPANAKAVLDSKIDLNALIEWHNYCETNAFTYDNVITDRRSLLDVLKDICAAGRSSPTIRDGVWTIVTDKVRTVTAQYFTPHNSWGFESVKLLPTIPHAFRIQFQNAEQGFQADEYIVYNDGYDATNATLYEQLNLNGVTTVWAIHKHARFHFAQIKLRPEIYTLNADIEHLVCTRGDLVKVSHDVPMWGVGSGRIVARVTSTQLELDEYMPMVAGTQYTIRIRLVDGSSITRTVASKVTDGNYNIITLTASVTTTEAENGNLFMFGALNSATVDLIVQSIEPTSNISARLTLVDYSPAVYTSDTEAIPAYTSNISLPPTLLQQKITTSPSISSIVSDESVLVILAPKTYMLRIKVTFTNPAELPFIAKYVEGQIDYSQDTSQIWSSTKSVVIKQSCIYFDNVQEASIYKMRLRYVSEDGRAGPWVYTADHTVIGKTNPPSTPTGLSATVSGSQLKLNWNDNPEPDIDYYEVRTSNSGWGTAGYLYQGTSSECLVNPSAIGVAETYFVKAIDVVGLYSLNAVSTSFTASAIPAVSAVNFSYLNTSLTTTSLVLDWADVAPQFGLSHYIITYNSTSITARTSTITLPVDWVGSRTFSVKTVDALDRQSAATSVAVTKTAPAAPLTFTTEVINSELVIKWAQSIRTTLPIQGYELRTSDSAWGGSGFLFKGSALNANVIPALGANTWYVKSFDTDGQYSPTALAITYTRVIPVAPVNPSYIFADTSLTNATVTLEWDEVDPLFDLNQYKITYDLEIVFTKSNTITLPANWVGNRTFSIFTIDQLSGVSNSLTVTVPKALPNPVTNFRAQVIDNNVLLYWNLPAKTTLPVQDVLLKKGNTFATAVEIGAKSGGFTSLAELSGGTYTYWIQTRDTDNNYSTEVGLSVLVSQPPDFVFNAQYFSTFNGTKSSAINEGSGLLLPVNTTETWTTHFTSRSWADPAAQIAAGYPIFIQPNNGSGSYVEIFDYGTVLGSSQIQVNHTGTVIAGSPVLSFTIAYSLDGITYTSIVGSDAIFATNFRYIRITANVTTSAATDLYLLNTLNVLLNAKQISDAGHVNAVLTDANGTVVNFAKEFVDVASITLTPSGNTLNTAVYEFLDTVINGTYTLTSNVATINATGHNLIAGQKVRIVFTSGTAPSGIYTVASVVNANQYLVNITTANTSGNISSYQQGFRVYLFNSAGARASGTVSWSIRGY
jgi:hypothetical protein